MSTSNYKSRYPFLFGNDNLCLLELSTIFRNDPEVDIDFLHSCGVTTVNQFLSEDKSIKAGFVSSCIMASKMNISRTTNCSIPRHQWPLKSMAMKLKDIEEKIVKYCTKAKSNNQKRRESQFSQKSKKNKEKSPTSSSTSTSLSNCSPRCTPCPKPCPPHLRKHDCSQSNVKYSNQTTSSTISSSTSTSNPSFRHRIFADPPKENKRKEIENEEGEQEINPKKKIKKSKKLLKLSKKSKKTKKSIREEAIFPPNSSTWGFDSSEDSDSVEIVENEKNTVPIPSFSQSTVADVVDLTTPSPTPSPIFTASISKDFSENSHIDMYHIKDLPPVVLSDLESMAESFHVHMELEYESHLPTSLMDIAWKQYLRNNTTHKNSPSASSSPSKSSDEEREKDDKEDEDSSFDGCDCEQTVFVL